MTSAAMTDVNQAQAILSVNSCYTKTYSTRSFAVHVYRWLFGEERVNKSGILQHLESCYPTFYILLVLSSTHFTQTSFKSDLKWKVLSRKSSNCKYKFSSFQPRYSELWTQVQVQTWVTKLCIYVEGFVYVVRLCFTLIKAPVCQNLSPELGRP